MNKVLLLAVGLFLAGCTPGYSDLSQSYPVIPDDLKDCKFSQLSSTRGSYMNVVRCPLSVTSTTYKVGKSTATTIVIDGREYVAKD